MRCNSAIISSAKSATLSTLQRGGARERELTGADGPGAALSPALLALSLSNLRIININQPFGSAARTQFLFIPSTKKRTLAPRKIWQPFRPDFTLSLSLPPFIHPSLGNRKRKARERECIRRGSRKLTAILKRDEAE